MTANSVTKQLLASHYFQLVYVALVFYRKEGADPYIMCHLHQYVIYPFTG
jgi:hypothetical protein